MKSSLWHCLSALLGCAASTSAFIAVVQTPFVHVRDDFALMLPLMKEPLRNEKVNICPLFMVKADETSSSEVETSDQDTESSTSNNNSLDQPDSVEPDTPQELMYTLGVNLARQLGDVRPLVEDGSELALVAKGLLDTVIGRLSEEGQRQLLSRRGSELNQLITDRANKIKDKLEQAGRAMLQEMAKIDNATTLPTGVVVHILEEGPDGRDGVRPTKASTVQIHYHGTMADGTVFDSTLGGEPVNLPIAGVIPGWADGVMHMHEGDTAMIGIPPEKAYGEAGTPDGTIPGGSSLFFKVQLLQVLTAGIGGGPTLLGADGKKLSSNNSDNESGGLLGANGKLLS